MRQMRRFAAMMVAGCLALTAAACGADPGTKPSELNESSTSSAATSSPPTSTSAPVDDEEQAVISQYKGWFEAVNGMGLATDEQVAAALAPYATEALVQNSVDVFANKRADGLIPGGAVVFGDIEVTLNGDAAAVRECRDGSSETSVEVSTGNVVAAGMPGTLYEADLKKDPQGTWLMSDYSALEGEC